MRRPRSMLSLCASKLPVSIFADTRATNRPGSVLVLAGARDSYAVGRFATLAVGRERQRPAFSDVSERPAVSTASLIDLFALLPPHPPQLIHLPHFATEDEDQRRVIEPDHHHDDHRQRPTIEARLTEHRAVNRKQHARRFERDARE